MAARATAGFGANLLEHSFSREGAKFVWFQEEAFSASPTPPRRRRPDECRRELDAAVGSGLLALRSIKFRLHLDRVAHGFAQGCARDRPSKSDPFQLATELTVRRVRRSRPAFIFPNIDRESMSIKFGFFDA